MSIQRFDLPRGSIFRVDAVDVRLAPGPHPFAVGRDSEIAANWEEEKAAKPALFDGEVALLASLCRRNGRLEGVAHLVRYATFLYWRQLRPAADAGHCYAMPCR